MVNSFWPALLSFWLFRCSSRCIRHRVERFGQGSHWSFRTVPKCDCKSPRLIVQQWRLSRLGPRHQSQCASGGVPINSASIRMMAKTLRRKQSVYSTPVASSPRAANMRAVEHDGRVWTRSTAPAFCCSRWPIQHHGKRCPEGDLSIESVVPAGDSCRGEGRGEARSRPLSTSCRSSCLGEVRFCFREHPVH